MTSSIVTSQKTKFENSNWTSCPIVYAQYFSAVWRVIPEDFRAEIDFFHWGGFRGGPVEPPKLNVKTYNKRAVKKK